MFVHLYVEIIYSLKLVDYLHVQADNLWYNNYLDHGILRINFDLWVFLYGYSQ